ncbi:hypothetical protein PNOK_0315100 [Pyrrhoderma noxium]|uniref:Uncharacterized protein n=1 Tax=Pyrrhoderma noxium TaxID=2282107 RepID=A0A286UM07_9AGAM|nr:hypothetical protein PNOK_0315100 [Pyrrhoderma noxium]
MNVTRILRSASTSASTSSPAPRLPRALLNLVDKSISENLTNNAKPSNLFETLSRLPDDGVGSRVHQTRWSSKGIEGCYWEISRVRLEHEGTRGKAWGRLVWRGKVINEEKEEKIRGVLKYMWATGASTGKNLKAVQPLSPKSVLEQIKERQPPSP